MGKIKMDLQAALDKDPAARSKFEIFFTYGGFKALYRHRFAHWFYTHKMKYIAQCISAGTRRKTGIDIHPAAEIAGGVFIDHGVGVVIGETVQIGTNVLIYQGVTLGGTGKDTGKRHPTIEDNVMISAGAKVLGPITVGHNSKIGAGSVVLKDVPPNSTVVGVPGRVVKFNNVRVDDIDQKLPDPILEEFARLNRRIEKLEEALSLKSCKYSIVQENQVDEEPNDNAIEREIQELEKGYDEKLSNK
ncbi:MAG: serine O-acetyltransferase [Clostridia bacterium]|nr:serine O-acetyltransferase [Clostridia bacterium]MDE7328274.1 serine O-acetyltransferase [Clostridia bacterium]